MEDCGGDRQWEAEEASGPAHSHTQVFLTGLIMDITVIIILIKEPDIFFPGIFRKMKISLYDNYRTAVRFW